MPENIRLMDATAQRQLAELYLTEEEFCSRYRVSPRSAQRWRFNGDCGPVWCRLGGRRVAYRLSDCEAWARSRTHKSRAAELAAA